VAARYDGGMMDERWNNFFYAWMLGTTLGGMVLNYCLAGALKRRATARNGIAAFVVGLLAQWGLGLPVILWIIRTYDVSQEYQESVGYFVGPFVLAFIAFPAALFVFYRPSFRRKVTPASG
jgi:hypothetical protein